MHEQHCLVFHEARKYSLACPNSCISLDNLHDEIHAFSSCPHYRKHFILKILTLGQLGRVRGDHVLLTSVPDKNSSSF